MASIRSAPSGSESWVVIFFKNKNDKGVVAHHLFSPKQGHGIFLRLDRIDEKSIAGAYRELKKQRIEEEVEDEGVIKELQSL
jgi:hypothetical protein